MYVVCVCVCVCVCVYVSVLSECIFMGIRINAYMFNLFLFNVCQKKKMFLTLPRVVLFLRVFFY